MNILDLQSCCYTLGYPDPHRLGRSLGLIRSAGCFFGIMAWSSPCRDSAPMDFVESAHGSFNVILRIALDVPLEQIIFCFAAENRTMVRLLPEVKIGATELVTVDFGRLDSSPLPGALI